MDAHYHIVMKAREEMKKENSRLYFAYSTILDRDAFAEWKQEHSYQFFNLPPGELACAKDTGLVFNFKSRWWGGRVASLSEQPGRSVWGMVFEVQGQDWPIVRHKEGFITGMCVEKFITVEVGGLKKQAIAFVTNPERATDDGEVSRSFLEALTQGARSAGLPTEYLSQLEKISGKDIPIGG